VSDDEPGRLKKALKILAPLAVIGAGVGAIWALSATAPSPEAAPDEAPGALVEVTEAQPHSAPPRVHANGTVVAAREASVSPRVAGRVRWVSPRLTAGGHFEEGQAMLRLDPTDYRLALAAERNAVSQARVGLMQQQSAREVSRRAWALAREDVPAPTETGRSLALNEPQVEAAEAQLEAARSGVRRARLNLSRTTLEAPFDAQVQRETVDPGQQVGPQTPVATLVGTDRYHVHVSIPVETVAALDVPPAGSDRRGADATVTLRSSLGSATWDGWVSGLLPQVDERGAMARVVVVVPDPLGLERETPPEVPLLLGAFVDVTLIAEPLDEDVVRVPRAALRDGDEVWVATADDELAIREVDVVWRREEAALVASGLRAGERVVVSRLSAPVDGMAVRLAEPDASGETETAAR